MSTAPVFAPDGTLGDVPSDSLAQAVKAGAKPGVNVIAPDGSKGVVPADRYVEAAKAGAKIAPFEEQDIKHPGFWASMIDDLKGVVIPKAGGGMSSPYPGVTSESGQLAWKNAQDAANSERQAGYSQPYMAAAGVAQGLGVNVPGMEQSAKEGDTGGVLGHAAAVPAAIAITKGAGRLGGEVAAAAPTLEDLGKVTPKQVSQVVGGASGAVAGHGTLSAPGAYYGAKTGGAIAEGVLGKEAANTPIVEHLANKWRSDTGTQPGAWHGPDELPITNTLHGPETPEPITNALHGPEVPPQEVLQGRGLAQGGQSVPQPQSAALDSLPVKAEPAPVYPGATLPETPSPAALQAQALMKAGGKLPIPPEAALGSIPVHEGTPAPTPPEAAPIMPSGIDRGPMPVHGESALNQILTGQDNANLLKIAKSRGINVAKESQLKPGIADQLLINKIINDFSPEELDEVGAKWMQNENKHNFGNIGPEAWKTLSLQTYFPELKIPAATMKRTQQAIGSAASTPVDDLTAILQKSLDAARKGAAAQ